MTDKKIQFNVGNCEIGTTLEYTIFSSADPNTKIIGTRTVLNTIESFTDIMLPGIADGTITVSTTLKDISNNVSTAGTGTIAYPGVSGPSGYSMSMIVPPHFVGDFAEVTIRDAELGLTVVWSAEGSGAGGPVGTASGTYVVKNEGNSRDNDPGVDWQEIDLTGITRHSGYSAEKLLVFTLKLVNSAGGEGIEVSDSHGGYYS